MTRKKKTRQNAMGFRRVAGYSDASRFTFDPDEWVELAYPCKEKVKLEKKGKEPLTVEGRFTVASMQAMVDKFKLRKLEDPDFSLLVNLDHLAMEHDQKTEAAGWLVDLKLEGERLLGRIKWSTMGEQLARGGVYRFTSVEVLDTTTPQEKWAEDGAEWDTLAGVAITNLPKLKKLKPFAHRADGEEVEDVEEDENLKGTDMTELKKLLGLADDAADDAVAGAIQALLDKVAASEAAAAEAELSAKAEAFSQKFGDRFVDGEKAVAFFRANPEQAEELAEGIKVPEEPEVKAPKIDHKPVAHRQGGTPEGDDDSALGLFRKWEEMSAGDERDEFLITHAIAINKGAQMAKELDE